MIIPLAPADITPDWLNTALESSAKLQGAEVTDCRVHPFGAEFGFASQIARLELTWDEAARNVPETMIAKLATTSGDGLRTDTLSEKNRIETSFYRDIGPASGVRIPRCYYVDFDETDSSCVLLLEDLAGARFGDAEIGCSPEDAGLVIDLLATLHARWWNSPRLDEFNWLRSYGKIDERIEQLPSRRAAFLDRYGELLPDDVRDFTNSIGPKHAGLLQRVGGPPQTLLHVDTHLDNIAFVNNGDSTEAVLFDWQGLSKGLCAVDVALFLSGALLGDDRTHEPRLLKRYHTGVANAGVEDYSLEQFHEDYRVAMLRWWIGTIGGLGSDYAASWTGRQAALAKQSVAHWCGVIRDCGLAELQ